MRQLSFAYSSRWWCNLMRCRSRNPVNSNSFCVRHVFKLCPATYKGQNSQLLSITYLSTKNTFNMLYDIVFLTTTVVGLCAIDGSLILLILPLKINRFLLNVLTLIYDDQLLRLNRCQTEPCSLDCGKWSTEILFNCILSFSVCQMRYKSCVHDEREIFFQFVN